jgi:shikimate kinase
MVRAADTSTHHIALIGSMGVGKSTIGKRLSEVLGRPFLDNDEDLRRKTSATAAELQARVGLDGLHRLEFEVLAGQLAYSVPAVVATAASVAVDPASRVLLRDRAFIIWLRAEPSVLAERTEGSSYRPNLAQPDPTEPIEPTEPDEVTEPGPTDEEVVRRVISSRVNAYATLAQLVIDTSEASVAEAVALIAAAISGPDASS